jgi:predicted GIY-YIG superfamily endonuclease
MRLKMDDKRILNGTMAYVFKEYEDGISMSDWQGMETNANDLLELAFGLIRYAVNCKDDIEIYNEKRRLDIEQEMNGYMKSCEEAEARKREQRKSEWKTGYVYMLECGGKYKIGFSKDVKRRMKQLDTRPFELKLVAQSDFLENAYDVEQEIHEMLEASRETGEWYNLSEQETGFVISLIKGV